MSENPTTIRPMAAGDHELILAWWGIPEVRKFTTTQKQPSFTELLGQLSQPGRRDFMIIHQGRRVGRTCLIDHLGYEELSLYIGELTLHGRGIGTASIRLTMEQTNKQVRAWITTENSASMKAFLANGFSVLNEEDAALWLAHPGGERT